LREEKKRIRAFIKGRVQGVGYRWFAIRAAKNHNILGWVRNLQNGSVEVLAEGDTSEITSFIEELKIGPFSAEVSKIEIVEEGQTETLGPFNIKFD
jgi:acylphosphatase